MRRAKQARKQASTQRVCGALSLRRIIGTQVWDFQCKERTRPLQQYARVFPKRGAFDGRVNALHAVDRDADGALAVVRACSRGLHARAALKMTCAAPGLRHRFALLLLF